MKNDEFKHEHGSFSINVNQEKCRITLSLIGSFNEVAINHCSLEIKKVVKSLNGAAFTLINNGETFDGATPEAYEASERFNEWLNTQNLIAKANITKSKVLAGLSEKLIDALHDQNVRFFDSVDEAEEWISEQEEKYKLKQK